MYPVAACRRPVHRGGRALPAGAGGKHIGVGLLDEDAAADALVRPLAEQDPAITFDPAALRRVLDESQCYPYYEHRRDELERQNLLPVAGAIADAFASRAMLAQDDLNGVIADTLALDSIPETVQRRDRLAMVGYVWKPSGAGDRWQPGIPSLMRYLQSPAAAGADTDART